MLRAERFYMQYFSLNCEPFINSLTTALRQNHVGDWYGNQGYAYLTTMTGYRHLYPESWKTPRPFQVFPNFYNWRQQTLPFSPLSPNLTVNMCRTNRWEAFLWSLQLSLPFFSKLCPWICNGPLILFLSTAVLPHRNSVSNGLHVTAVVIRDNIKQTLCMYYQLSLIPQNISGWCSADEWSDEQT